MILSPRLFKIFWIISICALIASFDFIYQRLTLIFSFPQAQIMPFVKAYANPVLYPTDPMVKTRFSYISLYPRYLGYLLKYFSNFELLIYVNQIFWILISLIIVFKIAKHVTRSERCATVSSAILFFQWPMFFGYQAHFRSLLNPSHNIVGFAFGVASIYALILKRRYFAFVILAAGAYFHSLSIVHLFVLLFLVEIFEIFSRRAFFKLNRYFPPALFCILISPLLFFELSNKRTYSTEDMTTFIKVNTLDSFPLSWSPATYFNFGCFILLALFCIGRVQNKIDTNIIRWGRNIIFASLILSLAGLVGVEAFRNHFAIIFQATRCTSWIVWIGSAFIASHFVLCFRRSWFFYLGSISILVGIFNQGGFYFISNPFFPIALLFFQLSENRRFWTWSRPDIIKSLISLTFISYWIYIVLTKKFDFPFFFDPIFLKMSYNWAIIPIFIFWLSILWLEPQNQQTKKTSILACLSFGISAFLLTLIFIFRYDVYSPGDKAWFEIQRQAKAVSQPNDAFVTPPWQYGFRVLSERMPITERLDGTQQYFSPEFGDLYRERMRALGFDPSRFFLAQVDHILAYNHFSHAQLGELKLKFGAQFYIVQKKFIRDPAPTQFDTGDLPILFENEFYRLVRIP